MNSQLSPKNNFSRNKERILLLAVSILLLCLFGRLYYNLSPHFEEAEKGYKSGEMLNLSKSFDPNRLQEILNERNYLSNSDEIEKATANLSQKITEYGSPENLGALNKRSFQIEADSSKIGSKRYKDAIENLGLDSAYFENIKLIHQPIFGNGGMSIEGRVLSNQNLSYFRKFISKVYSIFKKPYGEPEAHVLVRLEQYFPTPEGEEIGEFNNDSLYYVQTDENGYYSFKGLDKDGSYSVIPLKEGFEFGNKQGTKETGKLDENLICDFYSQPHTVRIFDTSVYQLIKDDKVFTIRTPQEFQSQFISWILAFFIAFWLVHLVWTVRGFSGDTLILPLLMLLAGISVLMMFAIQDPLRDTFRGGQTVFGVLIGLSALLIISQINIAKFFSLDREEYQIFSFRFSKPTFITKPWTWLFVAVALMALLLVFGTGPEGSGVKVNLWGFQPSEVTKYLVLLFFASYFAKNAQYLRKIPDIVWRGKNNWKIFIGFAFLLAIYVILGDMGPALVLCFTFLLLYAGIRGELWEMLIGASIYALLIKVVSLLINDSHNKIPFYAVTGLYFVAWYAYGSFKKDLKESAGFIVLLIAAFIFGEDVPKYGERLSSRNDIYRNIWNNDVYGGDQVAHGVWSLASGGWTGQGLGKGYSRVMPANHTDMILPSIGEELGFIGLLLIIICIGGLLYRSVLIARRAGQDFAFYLGVGIAIVTGSQFFLIASGSIGTVPLTGISVPFLSFGNAAMATNLAAFGIILSISTLFSTKTQNDYIKTNYDPIIRTGRNSFVLGLIKMALVLAWIQLIKANEYIIKPSLVVSRAGQRIYSQNPRIDILARKLEAGNIYDRNGLLLATSNKGILQQYKDSLENAGASSEKISDLLHKRLKRYYPFGEHLLFWLGDLNEGFSFNKSGYAAEFRHLTALRGFDNHPSKDETIESLELRENVYLPPKSKTTPLTKYDYSELIPLLKAGLDTNSNIFKEFKAKNRDIKLSVDAELQTKLQQAISTNSDFNRYRTSVVILNPTDGNVLASAIFPLPNYEILRQISKIPKRDYLKRFNTKFGSNLLSDRDLGMTYESAPGSTAKVLTAFAGLNKLGVERVRDEAISRNIRSNEKIRNDEPSGNVTMESAIINSSNVYFIWLSNKYQLDNELFDLYHTSGMNLLGKGRNYFGDSVASSETLHKRAIWQNHFSTISRCIDENKKGRLCSSYSSGISGASWGQGDLQSTPLSMARIAGTIANNGVYQQSKFLLASGGVNISNNNHIQLSRKTGACEELQSYMSQHPFINKFHFNLPNMAGKSGTPQRDFIYEINKNGKRIKIKKSFFDGWFVFFAHSSKLNTPLVICVRVEHNKKIGSVDSGKAGKLAKNIVEQQLTSLGYF